jgi:hypothetical protein
LLPPGKLVFILFPFFLFPFVFFCFSLFLSSALAENLLFLLDFRGIVVVVYIKVLDWL